MHTHIFVAAPPLVHTELICEDRSLLQGLLLVSNPGIPVDSLPGPRLYSIAMESMRVAPTPESNAVLGVSIAFLVLTWIPFVLRLYVRGAMLRNFGLDDYIMILTQIIFTASCILQIYCAINWAFGRHLWDLNPYLGENTFRVWYICETLYVVSTTLVKISVGFFLLRIARNKIHIWIIRVTMLLCGLFGTAITFVFIFQCHPVSDWWSLDHSRCLPQTTIAGLTYGFSALNIVADWTMSIVPAFMVAGLQMSKRQRILVGGLLCFAGAGCLATIARLPFIDILLNGRGDFLYTSTGLILGSTLEVGIGITAGCIAALRPLFHAVGKKLGFSITASSQASALNKSAARAGVQQNSATPMTDLSQTKGSTTKGSLSTTGEMTISCVLPRDSIDSDSFSPTSGSARESDHSTVSETATPWPPIGEVRKDVRVEYSDDLEERWAREQARWEREHVYV